MRRTRVRAAETTLLWPSAPGQCPDRQPAPSGLAAGSTRRRRVQSDAIQARPAGWMLAGASPPIHAPLLMVSAVVLYGPRCILPVTGWPDHTAVLPVRPDVRDAEDHHSCPRLVLPSVRVRGRPRSRPDPRRSTRAWPSTGWREEPGRYPVAPPPSASPRRRRGRAPGAIQDAAPGAVATAGGEFKVRAGAGHREEHAVVAVVAAEAAELGQRDTVPVEPDDLLEALGRGRPAAASARYSDRVVLDRRLNLVTGHSWSWSSMTRSIPRRGRRPARRPRPAPGARWQDVDPVWESRRGCRPPRPPRTIRPSRPSPAQ
jgi:hypothetical protein